MGTDIYIYYKSIPYACTWYMQYEQSWQTHVAEVDYGSILTN